MTAPRDAALTRHACQLLLGTGLDAAAAETLATDPHRPAPAQAAAAAAALRDGWATAVHACQVATGTGTGTGTATTGQAQP